VDSPSFNLIVFISGDFALMVYRYKAGLNTNVATYVPEFKVPFYPFTPAIGVLAQGVLLVVMGPEGLWAVLAFGIVGLFLYLAYGRSHAKYLGLLQPEYTLGILPHEFADVAKFKKELLLMRKNPLHHYQANLQERYKAAEVTELHTKKYEASKGRCGTRRSMIELFSGFEDMYIYRVCVTGGELAGKTIAAERIAKMLNEGGFDVYMAPEVPTIILNGGRVYNSKNHRDARKIFQVEMLETQVRMERAFTRIAQTTNRPSCVIVNQGCMDIKAHCEDAQLWEEVLSKTQYDDEVQ